MPKGNGYNPPMPSILYAVRDYIGKLNCDYEEITDHNHDFVIQKESKQLKFFNLDNLPDNIMDKDLIDCYQNIRFNVK